MWHTQDMALFTGVCAVVCMNGEEAEVVEIARVKMMVKLVALQATQKLEMHVVSRIVCRFARSYGERGIPTLSIHDTYKI